MMMVTWPVFIIYEALSIIVAISGNKIHLAAYALVDNLFWIIEGILTGCSVFIRTQMNLAIGKNSTSKFKQMLRKLVFSQVVTGALILLG